MRIDLASVPVVDDAGLPTTATALAGVDLAIGEGESVAIVGPTGSGKTTLLEVLAGITAPSTGRAELADGDGAPLRSRVGLVHQFPEAQFFEETVFDDVAFGPRRLGIPAGDVEGRVHEALARAGLSAEEFAPRAPLSLSAGEKRRAAIACILVLDRPFLVLDEPTAGLDPVTRDRIAGLIESEIGAGRGVAIVTHDLELADRVAGRTVVLSHGAVAADGRTADVFADAGLLERLGLTPPPRYELVRRLAEVSSDVAAEVGRLLGTPLSAPLSAPRVGPLADPPGGPPGGPLAEPGA